MSDAIVKQQESHLRAQSIFWAQINLERKRVLIGRINSGWRIVILDHKISKKLLLFKVKCLDLEHRPSWLRLNDIKERFKEINHYLSKLGCKRYRSLFNRSNEMVEYRKFIQDKFGLII
jgi:hypothetical protein